VGHVSTVGKALTWSPAAPGTESRKVVITVASQSNKTHIHIEERFELAGWRLFAPGGGAAVGGLSGLGLGYLVVGEPAFAIFGLIGAVGCAILTANAMIRIPAKRRRPKLEKLADRLAGLIEGSRTEPNGRAD